MYVCLGPEAVVRADEVVAVLDVRAVRASALNARLLERLPRGGPEGRTAAGGCRAVVVTRTGVLACSLSVQAVRRRLQALGGPARPAGAAGARGRGRAALTGVLAP